MPTAAKASGCDASGAAAAAEEEEEEAADSDEDEEEVEDWSSLAEAETLKAAREARWCLAKDAQTAARVVKVERGIAAGREEAMLLLLRRADDDSGDTIDDDEAEGLALSVARCILLETRLSSLIEFLSLSLENVKGSNWELHAPPSKRLKER